MIAPAFRPGDPRPGNDFYNRVLMQARRGRVSAVGPGLELVDRGLSRVRPPRIWAAISGSANPYAFQEAVPNAMGGFNLITGGLTDAGGLQPAYEVNSVANLGGTFQRLIWSNSADWRFQDIAGGGGGAPLGYVTIPSCRCPIPQTLKMTSAVPTCNYGMFRSCTLQWQAPPACFAPLNIIGNIFMSTTTFIDPFGNYPFYYYLYCNDDQYQLTRLYCVSSNGSPYRDPALYSWLIGGYGNSCEPFWLTNGVAYPGSDSDCSVTIGPG